MSNEGKKQEQKREKITNPLRNRKFLQLIFGAGTAIIIGGMAFVVFGKQSKMLKKEEVSFIDDIFDNNYKFPETTKIIDEDIFTVLAPAIEEAVIDKDSGKVILDRVYDLGNNLRKLVTVSINSTYED